MQTKWIQEPREISIPRQIIEKRIIKKLVPKMVEVEEEYEYEVGLTEEEYIEVPHTETIQKAVTTEEKSYEQVPVPRGQSYQQAQQSYSQPYQQQQPMMQQSPMMQQQVYQQPQQSYSQPLVSMDNRMQGGGMQGGMQVGY